MLFFSKSFHLDCFSLIRITAIDILMSEQQAFCNSMQLKPLSARILFYIVLSSERERERERERGRERERMGEGEKEVEVGERERGSEG